MKLQYKLGALLGAGLLTLGLAGVAFATAASTDGVTPTLHDSANITVDGGGNNDAANCAAADGLELDAAGQGTTTNGVTVTMTVTGSPDSIGFTATGGVVTIAYIKGGNGYNEYDYGAGVTSDSGLFAPDNGSDGPAGLSHAVFCTAIVTASESPSGSGAGDTDVPSLPPSNPPSDGASSAPSTGASTAPSGGGAGDTDQPTQPPTDTLGSNTSGGPSDGAWLLVVGLGVLLASVVVLTPARAKNRR